MAQIIFNPLVGVELPSTQEIRSDLGSRIQQAFQTSPTDPLLNIEPSSPMGQVLDLIVAEIEAKAPDVKRMFPSFVSCRSHDRGFRRAVFAVCGMI